MLDVMHADFASRFRTAMGHHAEDAVPQHSQRPPGARASNWVMPEADSTDTPVS